MHELEVIGIMILCAISFGVGMLFQDWWEAAKETIVAAGGFIIDLISAPIKRHKLRREMEIEWMKHVQENKDKWIKEIMGVQTKCTETYSTDELAAGLNLFAERIQRNDERTEAGIWRKQFMEKFTKLT